MVAKSKPETQKAEISYPEAPASWNCRFTDANGFECMLTIRGETGLELLEKAGVATSYLLENGCTPYVYSRASFRPVEAKSTDESPNDNGNHGGNGHNGNASQTWCPIHHVEMRRWDKNGRSWYSHKVDSGWCSGK